MMMQQQEYLRQQQQQQQRVDARHINSLLQQALKLIQSIGKEDNVQMKARMEWELENIFSNYPEVQKKLQEILAPK